jgi:hypothetical protein
VIASRPAPGTIALSWSDVTGADAYSVTRGELASLGSGSYGDCAAEGLVAPSYEDGTPLGDDEEEVTGGSPSTRVSRLEHRWTFALAAGAVRQLHVEGFRSTSTDGDDFRFEYSMDGTSFTPIAMTSLPFADDGIDLVGTLPGGAAGIVTIRVVDTDRTPGNQTVDSVSVDEVFVRAAP